jgi:hypothetical protein
MHRRLPLMARKPANSRTPTSTCSVAVEVIIKAMSPGEEIRLKHELKQYQELKDQLLRTDQDRFIVIKGTPSPVFSTPSKRATSPASQSLRPDTDFLVKQVLSHEPVFVLYA